VVTETYPPEINGVARTMGRMVDMLLQRGHAIDVVRPGQAADKAAASRSRARYRELLVRGVPIPRYGELQMGLAWPATLAAAWRESPPDVVQVVTEGPLGWSALVAARRLGIPVASDFHTNFHTYGRHYGFGWITSAVAVALRALHNRCAATMVPTEEIRTRLAAEGFRRLAVVGRGIDTALFSPARRNQALRAQWGCKGGEPVALYVGRLAPEKNLKLFVRAALAVRAVDPRTRIVLVGDGPDAAALRTAHPDFLFCGMRTGEDLAAHYASADIFLFPSITETFGNVTTEAMASGLAVVAFDYAAARQHIRHGSSGFLAPYDDAAAFIAAAVAMAESGAEMGQMRLNARAAAERLSWERVVDDLEEVLLRVADGIDAAIPALEVAAVATGTNAASS
jgi:glycosyltransferase involved in cell wall biosynthesis